jgi:hypothetical protein
VEIHAVLVDAAWTDVSGIPQYAFEVVDVSGYLSTISHKADVTTRLRQL